MSIWDGIEQAQADQRLPYLTPGSYRLALVRAEEGVSNKTREPFFRVTYRVLTSTGAESTPAGTTACVIFTKDKWGYYLRDIKNCVAAISGLKSDEVNGDIVKALIDNPDEAEGCEFQADVTNEPNKKDPTRLYTRHRFFAVPVDASFEVEAKAAAHKASAKKSTAA